VDGLEVVSSPPVSLPEVLQTNVAHLFSTIGNGGLEMASIRLTKGGLFEARAWQGGKRFSRTFTSQLKAQHWATGIECEEITNPPVLDPVL